MNRDAYTWLHVCPYWVLINDYLFPLGVVPEDYECHSEKSCNECRMMKWHEN